MTENQKSQNNKLIQETQRYVREALKNDSSGHDWWHTFRVWRTARKIATEVKADLFLIDLCSLLHDIGDWKLHNGDFMVGANKARDWLKGFSIEPKVIDLICDIILTISYRGSDVLVPKLTLEAQVVQDADRLDAIGAIGIARAFAYGGARGLQIYVPDILPKQHETVEAYLSSHSPTINHFYEKLLLLKDRMNTEYARNIAQAKHDFMVDFLKQFFDEWNAYDGNSRHVNGNVLL